MSWDLMVSLNAVVHFFGPLFFLGLVWICVREIWE